MYACEPWAACCCPSALHAGCQMRGRPEEPSFGEEQAAVIKNANNACQAPPKQRADWATITDAAFLERYRRQEIELHLHLLLSTRSEPEREPTEVCAVLQRNPSPEIVNMHTFDMDALTRSQHRE